MNANTRNNVAVAGKTSTTPLSRRSEMPSIEKSSKMLNSSRNLNRTTVPRFKIYGKNSSVYESDRKGAFAVPR